MKRLFISTSALDERAIKKFGLSNELLMENAAIKMANFVRSKFKKGSKILGVIGAGNNGADVLSALRMLCGDFKTLALICQKNQKPLCQKQLEIALKAGVRAVYLENLGTLSQKFDCVIDGLFGSGLNRDLSAQYVDLITRLNALKAYKIACDVPSGLDIMGRARGACFRADTTITMGARKLGLYSDFAKDFVGKVKLARLGVSTQNFQNFDELNFDKDELKFDNFLLTKRDLNLPFRTKNSVNKGDFGHAFVILGEHKGAARLGANAASAIGAGLVSVISEQEKLNLESNLMQTPKITAKMNAGALGMGLGSAKRTSLNFDELKDKSLVIDADLCYEKRTIKIAKDSENIVLTPHPKEFSALLKLANLGEFSTKEIQQNRFFLARKFSLNFACTLVLKGANTIIAKSGKLYIMPFGSAALAKGGSGDVLSGLIAGLLAQGYSALNAAISGTLAHALAARKFKGANYALNANDIIKGVRCLLKK